MMGIMNRDGLEALYTYNAYANGLVLETAAHLTEEEFTRHCSPSHGSVRELLIHMLAAEVSFLVRCMGRPIEFGLDDPLTLDEIHRCWDRLEQEQKDFIALLSAEDLAREICLQIRDRELKLPAWKLLVQAFLHSMHHRGELSIVLTDLGYPLPTLDIIIQFIKQSGQEWPWE
jgi:uncharacterized damage-inducible protein DinB